MNPQNISRTNITILVTRKEAKKEFLYFKRTYLIYERQNTFYYVSRNQENEFLVRENSCRDANIKIKIPILDKG